VIGHAAARALIADRLAAMPPAAPEDEWVILDAHTIERRWGWVFFYDSRRHRETGDVRLAVAGNAPYFVRRTDGVVFVTGTAYPIERYIGDFEAPAPKAEHAALAGLLREIVGDPFRAPAFDPRWRTADVLGLARGIYEDRAFDRLPLLADALMDAGSDSDDMLAHCRGEEPHVRGCWVVDLVLGTA
jgi:hypothetical protein